MAAERRRVLLLVPSFAGGAGGAERVFSILAKHLDSSRFEIHLALAQGRHAHLTDIPEHVVVHNLHISRMRYALPAIVKIARRVKPQVILSTVVYLNTMVVLAKPFFPSNVRVVLREAIMPSAFLAGEARQPRFWEWVYRRLYGKADKIVCLSESMSAEFADRFGVPREKLTCIYNPIDATAIRLAAGDLTSSYSGEGPHLVSVGRLQRQKGFDILLKAMPLLRRHVPNAMLTIVGEGPLEQELKAQAQSLGLGEAVHFSGFQPNPWTFIKHADVFVLPSRFEGMPNTVLEALALGTQAVATDCPGGVREIKAQFPELKLVAPEDPAALADAIVAQYRSGRKGAYIDGPPHFGKFGLDYVLRSYTEVLEDC